MILTKNNGTIQIRFKYDPRLIELVRQLPARQWNKEKKIWTIPLIGSNGSLKKLVQAGFKISLELEQALAQEKELLNEVDKLGEAKQADFQTDLPLYDFQKVVAKFMVKTGSCLNACSVGTGKTLMSLSVTQRNGTKKNLIITPKSLLWQWENECKRFLPEYKTFVINGNKTQREKVYREVAKCQDYYFLIMSYEQLRIDYSLINII